MYNRCIIVLILLIPAIIHPSNKGSIRFNGTQENELAFSRAKDYGNLSNQHGLFRWGVNSLTNLRVRADVGELVTFHFAINVNLLSGLFTDTYRAMFLAEAVSQLATITTPSEINGNYFSIPFYYKSTYIGGFELERMAFVVGNDFFSFEMGLMRLARGFGYAFSPTDYWNPKNPYNQKARPEGKLAIQTTFYPRDMWKINIFAVAPDNPLESQGWGVTTGTSTMCTINRFSFEFSYSLFLPEVQYHLNLSDSGLPHYMRNDFMQIVGASMKADLEIGLFIEAVYRFDHRAFRTKRYNGREFKGYEGLELSCGVDYTLPGGRVYLLTEYLFYGPAPLSWGEGLSDLYVGANKWYNFSPMERQGYVNTNKRPANFLRHDYIFNLIKGQLNDYLALSGSLMIGIDDISGIASIQIDIEPVQALSIGFAYSAFIDGYLFNHTFEHGEFGHGNSGMYNLISLTSRLRF